MYSSLLAFAATLSAVSAATQGFNYGAVTRTGATKSQSDFEAEFSAAKGLPNTNGAFSSARLYTMIQAGSTSDPIAAIPAAISQDVKLFLGMWASSGDTTIKNEIAALTTAITKYGDDFTSRVNGISVGSEDLYRITPTGLMNDPNSVGAGPDEIVSYIKEVRAALADTKLSAIPIGHVDTWTAWQNGSNAAVVEACDFLGMNTFPYFQTTESDNSIDAAKGLFDAALQVTKSASGGKPVIITETGWPIEGKTSAKAIPSKDNAKTYWDQVGCGELFGNVDVYWYTLVDANTDTASQPEFGVVGTTLSTTPIFDLTCPKVTSSSSSSSATATGSGSSGSQSTGFATSTGTSSGSATTGSASSGSGSGSGSGTSGSASGSASASPTSFAGSATSLSGSNLALGAVGVVAAIMAML